MFEPGHKKYGGKKKGSKEASTIAREWAEKNGGWDMLIRMAEGKEPGFAKAAKVRGDLTMYLMDRAYGKPTQAHEVGGPDDGPIVVSIVRAVAKAPSDAPPKA